MSERKKKKPVWPKKKKLEESIDVMWRFQQMCQLQLGMGNWATMDFPTKHHINKVLAIKFIQRTVAENMYGKSLINTAYSLMDSYQHYVAFTKKV